MFSDMLSIIVGAGMLLYMVRRFQVRDKYGINPHHVLCQCAGCKEKDR